MLVLRDELEPHDVAGKIAPTVESAALLSQSA
jgi:hypothetical protein